MQTIIINTGLLTILPEPCKEVNVIIPLLVIRKLRLRELTQHKLVE